MSATSLKERQRAIALINAYGTLLTETQARIMENYYFYDLSLAEIAEQDGISRAAVSEAIKNALAKMEEFESKLGLVSKKQKEEDALAKICKIEDPSMRLKAFDEYVEGLKNGI